MTYPMTYVMNECPKCEAEVKTHFVEKYFHTGECCNCGTTTMLDMSTWRGGSV